MSPVEVRTKRLGLGLTQGQAARLFGLKEERTWRRWEGGDQPISGPAARLLALASASPAVMAALRLVDRQERDGSAERGDAAAAD